MRMTGADQLPARHGSIAEHTAQVRTAVLDSEEPAPGANNQHLDVAHGRDHASGGQKLLRRPCINGTCSGLIATAWDVQIGTLGTAVARQPSRGPMIPRRGLLNL
jgi:hypothetical protein